MKAFVDLKNRLIVSSITIVCVSLLLYFSAFKPFQFVIMLVLAALAVIGIWEYTELLKIKQVRLSFYLLSFLGVLIVFTNYLAVLNIKFSALTGMAVAAFFFSIFFYNFYKVEGAIINIATCIFGIIYIVFPLSLMLRILYPATIPSEFVDGRVWLAYLIAVTKFTDVGAYFIGKLWGKSKLAPHLSPGKTMAGAVAGFISAIVMSWCFYLISKVSPSGMFSITLVQALVLGGILGVFSQLGDLAESLLKRDADVKDSNKVPGIGGVLDLLDSLLFTAPIVYLFLRTTHL